MTFKLIKFTTKSFVRKLLRNYLRMHHDSLRISSIYQVNNTNYILVGGSNISLIHSIKDVEFCEHLNKTQEQIYKWAISELLQTVEFIQIEHETSLYKNIGRILYCDGGNIIRTFDYLTEIYGILNYTEDSFSDGGKYQNLQELYNHAKKQIEYGVTILDVGVESTNPYSEPISASDEIERLSLILDTVIELKKTYKVAISIDTYHYETIKWLLDKEIDVINDVSGNTDTGLVKEITSSGRKYITMHSLVVPARKDIYLPIEKNPVEHIYSWMEQKLGQLYDYGINLDNIILDPGIGFGMTYSQAWFILKNFDKFYQLPCELMLGHSRKSFFKHIVEKIPQELDWETAYIGLNFIDKVDYLRMHDARILRDTYRIKQNH